MMIGRILGNGPDWTIRFRRCCDLGICDSRGRAVQPRSELVSTCVSGANGNASRTARATITSAGAVAISAAVGDASRKFTDVCACAHADSGRE
jgi:hypothetical protein